MAETETKAVRTLVTMIQDAQGITRRVRIGDTVIPVIMGAPIPGLGQMNFTMTIGDIDYAFERDTDAPTA